MLIDDGICENCLAKIIVMYYPTQIIVMKLEQWQNTINKYTTRLLMIL